MLRLFRCQPAQITLGKSSVRVAKLALTRPKSGAKTTSPYSARRSCVRPEFWRPAQAFLSCSSIAPCTRRLKRYLQRSLAVSYYAGSLMFADTVQPVDTLFFVGGDFSAVDVGIEFGVGNAHFFFVSLAFEQPGAWDFVDD